MKALRQDNSILLRFAPTEARMLRRIFSSIIRHYALKPGEVHPSIAAAWYSTRGCASARLDEEQTREWIQNLHHLKSANVASVRRWRTKIASRPEDVAQLELTDEDSHILLTVLNDHRLMCAARHEIGEEEMNIRTLTQMEQIRPRRRAALLDILFLGSIMETILALLPGNYGDWPLHAQ